VVPQDETGDPPAGITESVKGMHPSFGSQWPRRAGLVLCALLATLVAPSARAQTVEDAAWQKIRERWFTIEINGQRAGWAGDLLYDDGERYMMVSDQMISVARGDSDVATVSVSIASIEMHDGAPVEIRQSRRLGHEPEITMWVFAGETVERISRQNGREVRAEEELASRSEPWFMPHAAELFEKARREAGAEAIKYRSIDTSAGLRIITVSQAKSGETTHQLGERVVPVEIWTVRKSAEPDNILSETTVHVAGDGEVVFAEEVAGAMRFTVRSASREEAQRALVAAPELLAQTTVRPSRRIAGAAATVAATYRLRAGAGVLQAFPRAGSQRAEAQDDGAVLLTIDTRDPLAASEDEIADARYRAASTVIDCDDPAIVELARGAVSEARDATDSAKAEALRRAVHRHISRKDLASAFASASETVRSRSGDCSEHSVLLCAMLRAQEIPARVTSGLVYAESFAGQRHVFAWHMWTQALIDGRWIDLDATVEGPFSAAHILAGVTDLSSGAMGDEITRLVSLMGNLDIEVVSVEHR